MVGTGDTEPKETDYKLDNYVEMTPIAQSQNGGAGNILNASRTLRNDSSSPVIVKEVGLYFKANGSGRLKLLLARDVLPTPITMQPGESYTFTFKI